MSTTHQHYVPRTYLKAWETQTIENSKQLYVFSKDDTIGKGAKREKVLWKQNAYTICFDGISMKDECPLVYSDFVNQVYDVMQKHPNGPIYGKSGSSIITKKNGIRKHLLEFDKWEFYYSDGSAAPRKAISNTVHQLRTYILEEKFDEVFERDWRKRLSGFLEEAQNPRNAIIGQNEIKVDDETIGSIVLFMFMMMCRNPEFDGLGLFTWIDDSLLKPVFEENSEEHIRRLRYAELYRMLFKTNGGYYHTFLDVTLQNCQAILLEASDSDISFITSDNPAFINVSPIVETKNTNGLIFPLTPCFLLFLCKGKGSMNHLIYRTADKETIRYFNRAIYSNRYKIAIANQKNLKDLL